MHELSIIKNILEILEGKAKENNLLSISVVHIKIGELRQLVPEFLQMAFETAANDTVAEGARLIIELVPIKMHCAACCQDFRVEAHEYVCPACASTELTLLSGKEIVIAEIEGEVNDAN